MIPPRVRTCPLALVRQNFVVQDLVSTGVQEVEIHVVPKRVERELRGREGRECVPKNGLPQFSSLLLNHLYMARASWSYKVNYPVTSDLM